MCNAFRMVELLKTSDTSTERDQEVAEALSALLNGNGNKKRVSVRLRWVLLPLLRVWYVAPDALRHRQPQTC